jgi:hypothetical protein
MGRELKNAVISHVSYVDKAANQKKFFLTKSAGQPTFQKEVKIITKADDAQQLVYGIVYEPDVPDAHDDYMTAEEIEKAAHQFMKDARNIDTQHNFVSGAGEVVESYVAPANFEINGETIAKGSWVLVTKATDEIWEQIQKGEITGYSMAGTAEAIEKQQSPITKSDDEEVKGFFNLMKNFFTGGKVAVQKGEVRDKHEQNMKVRNFWSALNTFEDVIRSYNWMTDSWEFETDETKIREAIQDLTDILNEVLLTDNIAKSLGKPPVEIQKAGKKISAARMDKINAAFTALQELKAEVEEEEEEVMKAEDIQKMINDAVAPINEKLTALEKGEAPPTEPAADDTAAVLQKALTDALEPINKRLETIEKARGISHQLEDTSPVEVQKQQGYMRLFS